MSKCHALGHSRVWVRLCVCVSVYACLYASTHASMTCLVAHARLKFYARTSRPCRYVVVVAEAVVGLSTTSVSELLEWEATSTTTTTTRLRRAIEALSGNEDISRVVATAVGSCAPVPSFHLSLSLSRTHLRSRCKCFWGRLLTMAGVVGNQTHDADVGARGFGGRLLQRTNL